MDTFELDPELFSKRGAGDDKLLVIFHRHYAENSEKTAAEGRPIFDDLDFVKIITPGDRDNVIHRPVRPEDKMRFPRQWGAYKNGEGSESVTGTKLAEWPLITRGLVEEFKYFNVTTVEQLAELRDDIAGRMPGARDLQGKARQYLEWAANRAPQVKMQAEIEKRDSQIEALQAQIEALAARVGPAEGAAALPKAAAAK